MPDTIGTAYVDVKFDDAQVRRELTDLGHTVEQGTGSFDKLGAAGAKNMASVEKSTGKLSGTFSTLGRSLKSTAGLFGVGLGAAVVVDQFKGAIDAASNLNEQVNKSAVVFGKSGANVQKWSKGLAQDFGLSQRAALEMAGTFGNMLVPMGLSQTSAAKMSKQIVELGGDMASFNNASPEETLDALRAGLAGETEPLRRFGVFLSQARVEQEALSSGLVKGVRDDLAVRKSRLQLADATKVAGEALKAHGKDSAEYERAQLGVDAAEQALNKSLKGKVPALTAAQKAQATYAIVMKDTAAAQGDFARTSDSVANAQRVASAQWENLQAKIGQLFLPAVAGALKGLNSVLAFAQSGMPDIVSKFEGFGATSGVFKSVGDTVRGVIAQLVPMFTDLKSIIVSLTPVWRVMGDVAISTIKSVLQVVQGVVTIIRGVVQVVAALLRGDWAQAWEGVKTIMSGVLKVIEGVLELIVSRIKGAGALVKIAATALGNLILDGIKAALSGIGALATAAFVRLKDAIVGAARDDYNAALAVGRAIIDGLKAGVSAIGGAITTGLAKIHDAIVTAASAAYSLAITIGKQIVQGVLDGLIGLPASLAGKLKDTITSAVGFAGRLLHGSGEFMFTKQAIGEPMMQGVTEGVVAGTAELSSKLSESIRNAVESARKEVENARGKFSGSWGDLTNDALAAFDAIQGKLKTKSEKLLDSMELDRRIAEMRDKITAAQSDLASAQAAQAAITPQEGESDADFQARADAAKQRVLDADKALSDALYEQRRANLETAAAQERLNLDARIALRRKHLEDALTAEGNAFERGQTTADKAQKDLLKLLRGYGVSYKDAGTALGASFTTGFKEELADMERDLNAILKRIRDGIESVNAAAKNAGKPKGAAAPTPTVAAATQGYLPTPTVTSAMAATTTGLRAAGATSATGGIAGPPAPPKLQLPAMETQQPVTVVRVYLGDTELRDLVRTEVGYADDATARLILAGVS